MMGSETFIDLSLKNIWRSWFAFRKGKRSTAQLHEFQYSLEKNLFCLQKELTNGTYRHGGYRKFVVCDNKRREISVASIRDRVVHRLVYDYLTPIYDKTFIYDAWSCRVGKGLLGAITRTQDFLRRFRHGYVWKCDVKKFFDSVCHEILLKILSRKIKDSKTFNVLKEIIDSFPVGVRLGGGYGMPIGNLTSQIFANIYFNEFDRFVKHTLKPKAYLRYGDDFIMVETKLEKLSYFRIKSICFLDKILKLQTNLKSDKIFKMSNGLKFLGVVLWSNGRKFKKRNSIRIYKKLSSRNIGSYYGVVKHHAKPKKIREFHWNVFEKILI